MPLMKLAKNRVYASTLGHVIRFTKDEPVNVPNIMVKQCEGIGAVLLEDIKKEVVNEDELASSLSASINATLVAEGAPAKVTKQPVEPIDRMAEILKGVNTITDRNDREDFTAAGHISLRALGREVNFRVDKSELKDAMAIVNDPD